MTRHSDVAREIAVTGIEIVVAVALATGVVAALHSLAPTTGLGVLYLLAVLFIAIRRGQIPALITAVGGVTTLNYFFIEPRHHLTIADSRNVVALGVFLIAAFVVGRLAAAERQRAAEAEQRAQLAAAREREAEMLAHAASAVLAGSSIEAQLHNLGASIGASAGAASARVELHAAPSPGPDELALRLPTERRPAWLYVSRETGWEETGLRRLARPLAKLIDVALEREQIREQAAETEATQRADVAKTAVLHAISHDLRSPLTAITTAASGLGSGQLSDGDRDALMSVIETESARLSRLVDDLLDLSKIQASAVNPQPDWCDLCDIAAGAAEQVLAAHPDAQVEMTLPGDLPLVRADAAQLERVFVNVIENAVKFSPPATPVRISGGVGGRLVTVRVTDRGRGIPKSQRAHVFEPFFRGRDTGSGSGLGLAISRGFVEANGGRILLQTGTGDGTSFAISFPSLEQPATVQ